MDDLAFVIERLQAGGKASWKAVADQTGVPFHTIVKIARGYTTNPRVKTLAPLVSHYRRAESEAA